MFKLEYFWLLVLSEASGIFQNFPAIVVTGNYSDILADLTQQSPQAEIIILVSDIINKTQPKTVGFIVDSIYTDFIYSQEIIASLNRELIVTSLKDSESFFDDPSDKVQEMLIAMKEVQCDLYIVLITNGIQMTGFLQYVDSSRLINAQSNIVTLHDHRVFTPDLHYIWKRFVNVIFIRKCDTERNWYELSTVPFPARVTDVFVSRIVNYWTPPKRYRWPRKQIFEDKSNRHLNGEKLNVVVLQHTPTVSKSTDNSSSVFTGLEIDILNTLASAMNFTMEIYESDDSEGEKWGRKFGNDRNFTGMLGEMDGARADIALGDLHYTMFHLDIMDLSMPYTTECLTFITPEVLSDNSWKVLILPFSLGMWIGVLVSLFLIGVVFFLFSKSYMFMKHDFSRDFFDDISTCLLYTFSMILVVSLPRLPARWSVRVLTGWWWIYAILIVVAYRASLTAILANPQPRVTIDTLEVLAGSKLKCGAWGEENKKIFTSSSDPAAQKIGAKLEHADDPDDAIERVAEGDFAFFENQLTLQRLRYEYENDKMSAQNLHIMEECAIVMPISVGLEKNSPLKRQLDKYLRRMVEGGLTKKWLMSATEGFASSIEAMPAEALMDVRKFYGALVALACGYFLSLLAFAAEKLYWRFVIEKNPNYDKFYRKIIQPHVNK